MAVRTAYIGAAVPGVLTAANLNKAPGGWLGYVEATAIQTGITAEVDLTSLTLAVTVGASRRIRIRGFLPEVGPPAAGTVQLTLTLKEGATQLQQAVADSGILGISMTIEAVVTPTTGAHTYNLTLASGGAAIQTVGAATKPMSLLVEDIGPSA